jgi:hypothetical protein
MPPLEPHGLLVAASVQTRRSVLMQSDQPQRVRTSWRHSRSADAPSLRPYRVVVAVTLALAGTAAGGAGVLIGAVTQDHFEARPTPAETRALQHINAPQKGAIVDPDRGPNRADLGGGR